MERELWLRIRRALRRVTPTRPRNAVYTDRDVLAVFLWAVLHDRPVIWACERRNWPMQAWRRELPNQSTMSRRLKTAGFFAALEILLQHLQLSEDHDQVVVMDGKPLPVSSNTRDPDARSGRGVGGFARGYKVHVILGLESQAVRAVRICSMNESESTQAHRMLRHTKTKFGRGCLLLGDTAFDSHRLYEAAQRRGLRLVAPRRDVGCPISSCSCHPHRVESVYLTELEETGFYQRELKPRRDAIERFFSRLTCAGGGLTTLPPWVRRRHRVRAWVTAKLVINAARILWRRGIAA